MFPSGTGGAAGTVGSLYISSNEERYASSSDRSLVGEIPAVGGLSPAGAWLAVGIEAPSGGNCEISPGGDEGDGGPEKSVPMAPMSGEVGGRTDRSGLVIGLGTAVLIVVCSSMEAGAGGSAIRSRFCTPCSVVNEGRAYA